MDPNTIRLILIITGALLILLLYFWERHREQEEDEEITTDESDPEDDAPYGIRPAYSVRPYDIRPDSLRNQEDRSWDNHKERKAHETQLNPLPEKWAIDTSHVHTESSVRRGSGANRGTRRSELATTPENNSTAQPDFVNSSTQSARSSSASSSKVAHLEPLLIQVAISARRGDVFKGSILLEVAEGCGLHPGEMNILHCFDKFEDETRIYFSMVNMVKPGSFPFDSMEDFTTPGVMLFAQLDGHPEDMTILDEMLATARKMALALHGEVLDEARRPLTIRKEEELRQAVLANEARWKKFKPW